MRSRYSAFVVGDADYLRTTWHPDTCPARVRADADRTWTGLVIEATTDGDLFDDRGTVTFSAGFERRGRVGAVQECSLFVRVDGRWRYVGADPT